MGRSITTTLEAFAAHCDKHLLTRRPTIWAQYVDIWGEPCGELGVPDPDVLNAATFAALAPWAIIPTMGDVWLVVDMIEDLRVTHLHVNHKGMFDPHWSVAYMMTDEGRLWFGEPVSVLPSDEIAAGVAAAKKARHTQALWENELTVDTVMPIVHELLNH